MPRQKLCLAINRWEGTGMNTVQLSSPSSTAHSSDHGSLARLPPWLRGRRGLILTAVALAGLGLALGWNWLAAAGVAPLLLSLLPCAAMCALGFCMMGKGEKSCATSNGPEPDGQVLAADVSVPRPSPQGT
jgi:hypothetical protein